MTKAISYSLFGYNQNQGATGFNFFSFLTSFSMCVRMNRLVWPGWVTILHVDQSTYDAFAVYFEKVQQGGDVKVVICEDAPLCKAMLWRLKPVFERSWDTSAQGYTTWKYTHVICRDLDSPTPYRDRQCVEEWVKNDKAVHAICDSDSHTIPMMGGMIGFRPDYITERLNCHTWDDLLSRAGGINFDQKGSDQDFLNREIYPRVARQGSDSITQHYMNGCANTFLSDYHNRIPEIELPISEDMKESNGTCYHLGQAGWYLIPAWTFFDKYKDRFADIEEAEREFTNVFYWIKN